jgi:hypothetical protein
MSQLNEDLVDALDAAEGVGNRMLARAREAEQQLALMQDERNRQLETEAGMKRQLDAAWQEIAVLKAKLAAKQARIDELMMEYCPDEMTEEQLEEWSKHQRAVKVPK